MLAELQRRNPDATLIDTLLALDAQREDNFDELYEASELALGLDGDTPRAREILNRLKDRAAALWNRGLSARGQRAPRRASPGPSSSSVACTIRRASAARPPTCWPAARPSRSPPRPRRPCACAPRRSTASSASAPSRSTLYRGVVDERPDDLDTVCASSAPCSRPRSATPSCSPCATTSSSRTDDPARKLELRLDVARVVGIVEQRGGRIAVLRRNLEEQPSHDPSLAALTEVLPPRPAPTSSPASSASTPSASRPSATSERAVRLWSQLAELAEQRLGDVERALSSHRRVVPSSRGTTPSTPSLACAWPGASRPRPSRG
jgi:hypothetical protein